METGELDDFYHDAILDHSHDPRNAEALVNPNLSGRAVNPFCGDEVDLQINLDGQRVSEVGVQGQGCSINQASSSLLSQTMCGRSVEDIEVITDLFKRMLGDKTLSNEESKLLGDLTALAGVRKFPVRLKCVLLAWSALEEALGGVAGRCTTVCRK